MTGAAPGERANSNADGAGSSAVAPPGDATDSAGSARVVGGITYPDCNLGGGAVRAAPQIAWNGSSGSLFANSIIPLIVALRSP